MRFLSLSYLAYYIRFRAGPQVPAPSFVYIEVINLSSPKYIIRMIAKKITADIIAFFQFLDLIPSITNLIVITNNAKMMISKIPVSPINYSFRCSPLFLRRKTDMTSFCVVKMVTVFHNLNISRKSNERLFLSPSSLISQAGLSAYL